LLFTFNILLFIWYAHLQRGPSRFFDRIRWAVAHTPV